MWVKNSDTGKWQNQDIKLSKEKFDSLKEDLKKLRYYSKCKDGIGYFTTNDISDLYNITNHFDDSIDWYVSGTSSIYGTNSNGNSIISTQSISTWNSVMDEYGFTIKNLYNPNRVINTAINNYKEIDLVTNEQINNLTDIKNELFVDGIRVLDGHKVLVKDQITYETYIPQTNYIWNGNWSLGNGDWYQETPGQLWVINSGVYEIDHTSSTLSRKLKLNFEGTKSTVLSFTANVQESLDITLLSNDDIILYTNTLAPGLINFNRQIDTDKNVSKISIVSRTTAVGGLTTLYSISIGLVIKAEDYFQHEYFQGTQSENTYYYYNEQNGVYRFDKKQLVRENDLQSYTYSLNYSVTAKIGTNKGKQFHLHRLKSGLYPTDSNLSPYNRYSFFEAHNWIVRNKNQYNNSLDLNYYDILQTSTQSVFIGGLTYSILPRTLYIGEYGSILNYQNSQLNIIYNRYKERLNSISETENYYWVCGNSGILLKIDKLTFDIEKIDLNIIFNLKSIDFLNSNKGFLVGEYNTIFWTDNGGKTWIRLEIPELDDEIFNTVEYYNINTVFIGGNRGFLLRMDLSGDIWNVTKVNLIKKTVSDGNYDIFDNISQIYPVSFTSSNPWNLVVDNNGVTQSTITNKDSLFIVGDNNLISILDINGYYTYDQSTFIIAPEINGNITSISNVGVTFSISTPTNVYKFNINNYTSVGTVSNTLESNTLMTKVLNTGSNKIDYSFGDFNLCGDNTQILKVSNVSSVKIPSIKLQFLNSGIAEDDYIQFTLPNGTQRYIFVENNSYPYNDYGYIYSGGSYASNTVKDYILNEVIPVLINDPVLGPSYSVSLYSDDTILIEANGYQSGYDFSAVSTSPLILVTASVTASTTTIDLVNQFYKDRVKSKYLFLDYDIASKMYFFDDNLTYRLPSEFAVYGYNGLSINSTHSQSLSLSAINGENNWITYYKDELKQFRFGDVISDSSKVQFSTTFSKVNNTDDTIGISSDITGTKQHIYNLIPFKFGSTASITGPSVSKSIYLWDDIMILNLSATALGNVGPGDMLKFDSDVVSSTFMVNKTETLSGRKYVYIKSDFNQSMINNLVLLGTPSTTSVTNINRFHNTDSLESNFGYHPLSSGYGLSASDHQLSLNTKLTNYTAYYNMQTSVVLNYLSVDLLSSINTPTTVTSSMLYNDSFMSFGFKPTYNIQDYLYRIDPVAFTSSKTFDALPHYYNINVVSSSTQSGVTLGYMTIGTYSPNILKKKGEWTFNENEIAFTPDLKFEWETLLKSTYVDVYLMNRLDGNDVPQPNMLVSKLLITGKYYSIIDGGRWVIQFDKRIDKKGSYRTGSVHILSRNRLDQISSDLEELNNIHSPQRIKDLPTSTFTNYESDLLNRFYTDNYTKVLLSDHDIKSKLTSIAYIDSVGQLSVSIVNNKSTNKVNITSASVSGTSSIFYTDSNPGLTAGDSVIMYLNSADGYGTNYQSNGYKIVQNADYQSFTLNGTASYSNNIQQEVSIGDTIFTDDFSTMTWSVIAAVQTLVSGRLQVDKNGSGGAGRVLKIVNGLVSGKTYIYTVHVDVGTTLSGVRIYVKKNTFGPITDELGTLNVTTTGEYSVTFVATTTFAYIYAEFIDTSLSYQIFSIDNVIVNEVDIKYSSNIGYFIEWVSDPNLNYTPIDLIDVGVDKNPKKSILIKNENIEINDNIWSLNNIDYNRFRFRLVDNLNLQILSSKYPWLLEAEIEDAIIGHNGTQSIWYSGLWECGRWFDGIWVSGKWLGGDWYNGQWYSYNIKDNYTDIIVDKNFSDINRSKWYNGRWYDGTRYDGKWYNGRWYDGTWINGTWYGGRWNDGMWKNGSFIGGDWVRGTWENGIFNSNYKDSSWIDGTWYGGDFENGTWYGGIFTEYKSNTSRFGTKSSNSKRSLWLGGKFNMGEFHSRLNTDSNGNPIASVSNKYSTWYTGEWSNGTWYGGTCYIINWQLGTWYGGIVKPLQLESIIGTYSTAKFQIDGEWRFNIGDNIWLIDSITASNPTSSFVNVLPMSGKIESIDFDYQNSKTYINTNFGATATSNPAMILAPHFGSIDWKNGIWYNGIFNGTWESGIWYNGIFESGKWTPDI